MTYDEIISLIGFHDTIIKSKKLKKILRNFFLFIIIISLFVNISFGFSFSGASLYVFITMSLGILGYFVVILLTTRYYNWTYILFVLVFIGLLYKRMHWLLAGVVMSLGISLLGTIAYYNSFKYFSDFRNNTFLKWFGFLSGIIVALFMTGFMFKHQHWPGGSVMLASGSCLFIFTILALIFTLPFSNYVSWSDIERQVFFRSVLIPMIFVFALFTFFIVFQDTYNTIMLREGEGTIRFPYEYNDVDLFDLEGILSN